MVVAWQTRTRSQPPSEARGPSDPPPPHSEGGGLPLSLYKRGMEADEAASQHGTRRDQVTTERLTVYEREQLVYLRVNACRLEAPPPVLPALLTSGK